ncbi:MAG: SDR family oxidoreductase [Aquiluna sp.]
MKPDQLKGATVLITGASKGIGRAIALELADRCRRVIAVARDPQGLSTLTASVASRNIETIVGDVCEPHTQRAILSAVQDINGLDVLINNAGTSLFKSFRHQTEQEIRSLMETNLIAPMLLTQALLPELLKRSSPEIIQIGSTFSQLGHPGYATYCASKAGLRLFSQALDRELADSTIRVRTFSPRATQTTINSDAAMNFMQSDGQSLDTPEAVGQMFCRFLESGQQDLQVGAPERFFVWLNQTAPDLVRRALAKKLTRMRQHLGQELK